MTLLIDFEEYVKQREGKVIVNVTTRGRITIPKAVRDRLGIRPGDRIRLTVDKDRLIVQRATPTLTDLRGSVKPRRRPEDFEASRAVARDKLARRRTGS
jgi:AbrB family looped-hinge helix DNA binding protein